MKTMRDVILECRSDRAQSSLSAGDAEVSCGTFSKLVCVTNNFSRRAECAVMMFIHVMIPCKPKLDGNIKFLIPYFKFRNVSARVTTDLSHRAIVTGYRVNRSKTMLMYYGAIALPNATP